MDNCQVLVYSGRGSGQVWIRVDEGRGQRAGQEISPAGVGDCLDSTTRDTSIDPLCRFRSREDGDGGQMEMEMETSRNRSSNFG